jgi:hypothetical protein
MRAMKVHASQMYSAPALLKKAFGGIGNVALPLCKKSAYEYPLSPLGGLPIARIDGLRATEQVRVKVRPQLDGFF